MMDLDLFVAAARARSLEAGREPDGAYADGAPTVSEKRALTIALSLGGAILFVAALLPHIFL